ncbi:hypothetical protein ACH5RR_000793 [Cinchona calisaya]|uniref:Uncharacterized protein n=1 Tax=Cinchona calisaya TaxID=153742 RepID=A0ABD3B1K3_9GENT
MEQEVLQQLSQCSLTEVEEGPIRYEEEDVKAGIEESKGGCHGKVFIDKEPLRKMSLPVWNCRELEKPHAVRALVGLI